MTDMEKTCNNCLEKKQLTDFYNYRNTCKTCENKKRYELKKKLKSDPKYLEYYRRQDADLKKKKRSQGDSKFNFIEDLRTLVRQSIKNKNYTKKSKTFEILGIDCDGFLSHIESQFVEGMSWDNHGLYGWHVDHIIPVSSASNEEEIIKLNHYTNLRPLWAKENLQKGNKLIM